MWLVLSDAQDMPALWMFGALKARGLHPLAFLGADQLALCDLHEHCVGKATATLRLRTASGLQVDGTSLKGVLNRLYMVPLPHWSKAPKSDQDYVQQEIVALLLSWLHALPCPVINRPTPQGLCGRWRQESEWAWLAREAGLPVAPYRQSATDGVDEMKGERRLVPRGVPVRTVIALGGRVFGASLLPAITAACQRLARLSQTQLLGIDFVDDAADAWTFAGASPTPDLSIGGEALVEALMRELSLERAAA
jgi:hypothetical protein